MSALTAEDPVAEVRYRLRHDVSATLAPPWGRTDQEGEPMRRFHRVMYRIFGHYYCCHIADWTAHVGFPWRPIGEGRWNLYNTVWHVKNRIRISME